MDRLDEELKTAMDALEGGVPGGYFDQLAARIASRLEAVEMAGTDSDLDTPSVGDAPPPSTETAELVAEEEHSGLHDIKELARSQKQRISKRMNTQSDAEESLLASASTSGLRAVALPDPTKEVKAPVSKSKKGAGAKSASAAARVDDHATDDGSTGIPMWVYAGVATVAAAAVIFFVVRGKGTKDTKPPQVARAGMNQPGGAAVPTTPPTTPPTPAPTVTPAPAIAPSIATTDKPTADPESGNGAPETPAAADPSGGAKDAKATTQPTTKPVKVATNARRRPAASKPRPRSKPTSRAASKPRPKPRARKPAASGKPKSMDDLLTSVTGVKKDGASAKPAVAAKPSKTSLTRGDIRSAMNRVKGRATGCYAKHKESGTVTVFVKVAPSGKIRSVKPRGKWSGTPTGKCVASAVRGAKFPAWDGRPMSFPWPFLLSP